MPLINLEQFKTLFPETKVEISDEQVKWYVKENIYKGSDPVYENEANEQMQLLIEKANELGLKNFKDLFKHAKNKQIKESVEAILYLLQGKDISLYQDRTFECGPGTLTNLQSIILDITGAQSLQSVVSRYKKEMLEEFAKELLKKGEMFFKNTLHIRDGMEVHNVTSILNVIADDFGVIKDIKDPYVHNFTDNEVIKKIKDYYTEEIKKLTSGDISGGIVAKLEQSLLEFDKFRINEEDYATRWYFREFSKNVEKYNDEMPQIPHKRLDDDDKKSLFAKILMVTDIGATIGFKDNYRDILKDFIALYLDDKKVIVLDEAEKKEIITKVKIETRSAFTEGEINDEVLKYAIAHDLYIDMGTELSAIDPVQKYLKSGDVLKRQYAIDHIKNNCDKYGGNATEITSQVENPTNAYYTYSDFITQRKFDKASAIARFFDKYNEKVAKSASLDESEKGNTTHIIDLLKAEELRKLREYNAQKEVILSRNKDGKRPLDILYVNPLFSSITSHDKDGVMSILSEARECTILREVLTAKDKNGNTALHYAADSGKADVVEKILAVANDVKVLNDLLIAKDNFGFTALHLAAEPVKADVVKKILDAAKDQRILKEVLTAKDRDGERPLDTLFVNPLFSSITSNDKDSITSILSEARECTILREVLTAKDKIGYTALHYAAKSGKVDVVEKILATISNDKEILKEVLTAKDQDGNTVLLSAAKSDKADVVEKILAAIGNNKELLKEMLTAKDKNGDTVLNLAAESGKTDVVSKILAAIGDNKELLKEVLTAKDQDGNTVLRYAADSLNRADVVEKILATISNDKELLKDALNAKDKDGNTVLHSSATKLGKADVVEKILATISNDKELLKDALNAKNKDGNTVLHYAAQLRKADVVEKILAAIGDNKELLKEVLIVKNKDEKTVVGLAVTRFATVSTCTSLGKILEVAKNLDILGEVVDGCGDSLSCLFKDIKNPVQISDNITLCSSDYFVKECKDLVTPAKWSNMLPNSWVKNTSETGTYWKERDALIEKVVEKYLTNHGHIKTTDKDGNQTYLITEQIDKIKSEIRDNIASHKEEITDFLNKKGHYNVQPKIIKEELEKRDNEGKSFVEKLQEKKSISNTNMNL